MFQYRKYTTGWVIRFWRIGLKFNNQDNYQAFSIEWLKPHFRYYGGK